MNQTYKNIELLIVDDGSFDETAEIIKSYRDKRIKRIKHHRNSGLPKALNTGFAYAVGSYLTWTSHDNQYLPGAIEEMVTFLKENNDVDFVYADCWLKDLDTGYTELRKAPDALDLSTGNRLMSACFLYTRRVFETVGYYDSRYRLVEDYDYWIRVTKKFQARHYSKALYYYGLHSESLTRTVPYSVMLLTQILKYKNGFITLSKMSDFIYESNNMPRDIIPYLKSIISISTRSFEFCILCSISSLHTLVQAFPKYLRKFLLSLSFQFSTRIKSIALD